VKIIGRRQFIKSAAGLAAIGALPRLAAPAIAQGAWPNKTVRLVVPLAPGGAIDFIARQCGEVLSRNLGQQFVVENRTGAGGTIGMDSAMKSPPDGYTLLITNDNAASAPHILNLAYDYTKELVPVIDIGHQPLVFASHPSLGVNTVAEYVANAKKNPGVGYGSVGNGSSQHLAGALFATTFGLKQLVHVPYKGTGPMTNDLVGGQITMAFANMVSALPHVKAKRLNGLAVTSLKRSPSLPELPALAESVPGFEATSLPAKCR